MRAFPTIFKVILIGPPGLYYQLHAADEDFRTMFKVMADFDETVPRTAENELGYAVFIATRSQEENLLHLDREAVGRALAEVVGDEAVRLTDDGAEISIAGSPVEIKPKLVESVLRAGGKLQKLEDRGPTLEDLFLRLTGADQPEADS